MKRLGILGSTRGTNLIAIAEAINQQKLNAKIEIVISNKINAPILQRAKNYHIPAQFIDSQNLTREAYDAKLSELFKTYQVELIVLVGYMRILSAAFVKEWQDKIINVHPSLLPAFAGKMDLDVHAAVLAAGVEKTGCTVHYVTEAVDGGPIILQKDCKVYSDDSPESLKIRVQELESAALVEAIQNIK